MTLKEPLLARPQLHKECKKAEAVVKKAPKKRRLKKRVRSLAQELSDVQPVLIEPSLPKLQPPPQLKREVHLVQS